MEDILDRALRQLDRQPFLDRLATFGADADFSVSNLYATWSLSIPIVAGKD
jgi:hypothetical protein